MRSEEVVYTADEVAEIQKQKRAIASFTERLAEVADTSAAAAELRLRDETARAAIRAVKTRAEVFRAERVRSLEETLRAGSLRERLAIADARLAHARTVADLRARAAAAGRADAAAYFTKLEAWTFETRDKMEKAKSVVTGVASLLGSVGGLFRRSSPASSPR